MKTAGLILPGINIQFPISREILEGAKTVETRFYKLPKKFVGEKMFLIETPGKIGKFKSRIVAIIRFGESFQYKNKKHFYEDTSRHLVTSDSQWRWVETKKKWGWPIEEIEVFKEPAPLEKRAGIVYTQSIRLPSSYFREHVQEHR